MPLAWLGTRLEGFLREQERGSYNKLLNWARNPNKQNEPGSLILRSLVRTFTFSALAFYGAIITLYIAAKTFFSTYPGLVGAIDVRWPHLWIAASIGGVVALRLKRAYAILIAGIALYALFVFSSRF